jgi:hypothetical protein
VREKGQSLMPGQKEQVEVVRDCLRILQFINSQFAGACLTAEQIQALDIMAHENLDALLQPIYHKMKKDSVKLEAALPRP